MPWKPLRIWRMLPLVLHITLRFVVPFPLSWDRPFILRFAMQCTELITLQYAVLRTAASLVPVNVDSFAPTRRNTCDVQLAEMRSLLEDANAKALPGTLPFVSGRCSVATRDQACDGNACEIRIRMPT